MNLMKKLKKKPYKKYLTNLMLKQKVRLNPRSKLRKNLLNLLKQYKKVEEEPAPVKVDKLKQIVKCSGCNMDMTVHALKYIHKRRGFCKAEKAPEKAPETQKPKITEDMVNQHIKENLEIVSSCLRNERSMKAQRKQIHVPILLNNAC